MNTLRMTVLLLGLAFSCLLVGCATGDFTAYNHIQWNWPTAPGALVRTQYAVPVYCGLPARPYIVLGYMNAEAARVRGSALVEYEARKAKEIGGDAIIVQTAGAVSSSNHIGDIPPRALGSVSGDRFGTWWGNTFPIFAGASALIIKFK